MILAVPVAVAVNVTEHVPAVSVQLANGVKLPAGPVSVNETVPVGVLVVPAAVSATVAVQVDPWLTTTGEVHATVVDVVLALSVTDAVPLLVA